MKIINAKVEELVQKPGYKGMLEQIERGGRVCYKSEDKITDGSAEKFVNALIKRKHFAPLEHGTVYLKIPEYSNDDLRAFFEGNKYSYIVHVYDDHNSSFIDYITTNYRVIVENDLVDLIAPFICDEPNLEYHRKRRSFMITCDRGVSHEIVRHRVMSFNQESTRYVNYSNDKWGNELTVIKPCFWNEEDELYKIWKESCEQAEANYMRLIAAGATPEKARSVLPNSVKTEILVTGFDIGVVPEEEDGWEHFLKLRCDVAAHPQIREIANMIKDILDNKN